MLKNVGLLAAGLIAGLMIMTLSRPLSDPPAPRLGDDLIADATSADNGAASRSEVDARIAALEERIARLEAQRSAIAATIPPATSPTQTASSSGVRVPAREAISRPSAEPARPTPEILAAQAAAAETQRLIVNGFAPDRAEWVKRKVDELRLQELQQRYEAQRNGTVWPANELDVSFVDRNLRAELGDDDYERYMRAFGRPTVVAVNTVYAGSPAATAGIVPGDRIVSYGGKRVFDQNELNAFILDGTPGESVVVEVERNGQRLQVIVPRGPMGVTGSGTLNTRSAYGVVNSGR